ncbi:MAG: MFS transporter [Chloroflexota bacterium]
MLIGGIALGLILGFVAGGRLENLLSVRLRLVQLTFFGLFLRVATQIAIDQQNAPIEALRAPLFLIAFAAILAGLWANREHPGLSLAFLGVLLNTIAVGVNGGHMPVWLPALQAAGFAPDAAITAFHIPLPSTDSVGFLLKAGPLGDILPIPIPIIRNVASIGDAFLALGLAFFLFSSTVRSPLEVDEATRAAIRRRLTSITPWRVSTFPGTSVVATGRGMGGVAILGGPPAAVPTSGFPPILDRVRHHPYVRLALDQSFAALWAGQLISLVGDRIHQVAIAFVVLYATGSPIAVGIAFFFANIPNLLFGAIAGTLVDRWDHREVMIVSDLLRAALVLLLPIAAAINLILIYPIIFLITTISVFFRPAKGAILPRIVAPQDLNTANSAMWIVDSFADIGGYAIAGLFVALLGPQLPLAFWADAVTYIASAFLIASISVAPVKRAAGVAAGAGAGLLAELRAGWAFLRREHAIFANTLQAVVAQFMLGVVIALMPIYAQNNISGAPVAGTAVYGFLEGGIGAGNLIGGFVIGLIGSRIAIGRMVILGYVITGGCIAALAITGNFAAAMALTFGAGVGNLAFVIPSQTLVQKRTPPGMMGRLLGIRFTMVAGSMAIATAVGGFLGFVLGIPLTIAIFGLVTVGAGLAGLFVPAVRDA